MQGQIRNLRLTGSTTTTTGARWTVELNQLSQLIGFGDLFAFLAILLLELTVAITNSTGGGITVNWEKLYDSVVGIDFNFKAAQKHLWEFTQAGGQAAWVTFYLKFGRFPDVQSDVTINNGATGTLYLAIPLTFFDPRADEPEDELIWNELLVNSTVDFTYGAAGTFGANTSWTVTPNVSVLCVPRNDQRFPTMIRHTEEALTSFAQSNLSVNGYFPQDVVVMPYNAAAGQTMQRFAAADITAVKLVYDGVTLIDSVNPTTLAKYSNLSVYASGDRLGQWEAGSNKMLQLVYVNGRQQGLKSKVLFASNQPTLFLTGGGGIGVTNFRMLYRLIIPSGKSTARAAFSAIGMAVQDTQLMPRASSRTDIRDRSVLQVIPWTVGAAAE